VQFPQPPTISGMLLAFESKPLKRSSLLTHREALLLIVSWLTALGWPWLVTVENLLHRDLSKECVCEVNTKRWFFFFIHVECPGTSLVDKVPSPWMCTKIPFFGGSKVTRRKRQKTPEMLSSTRYQFLIFKIWWPTPQLWKQHFNLTKPKILMCSVFHYRVCASDGAEHDCTVVD